MIQKFRMIYENGVLRPLSPLPLSEREVVTISMDVAASAATAADTDNPRSVLMQLLDEGTRVPARHACDGHAHREHDRIPTGHL